MVIRPAGLTRHPRPGTMPPMAEPGAKQVEIAPGRYLPEASLSFQAARSGGPGGQHVNTTSTAVTLTVPLAELARVLPRDALARLRRQAGHRLAGDRLMIRAAESRSQQANRKACLSKLREMIVTALHRPRPRRPTGPSKRAKQRRVEAKKQRGRLKQQRRANPNPDD